jgi:hypothetical protein
MKKRTRSAAALLVGLTLLGGGLVALDAQVVLGQTSNADRGLDGSEGLTRDQRQVAEAWRAGGPIGVVDQKGDYQGTVLESESSARDERILAQVERGFREPVAPYDEEYERLWESLAVLDPVAVTDAEGETVGYWIGRFVTPGELEAARPSARQLVQESLG